MLVRQKVASGGSGSTYIYGFLDSNYRPDFTADECVDFIRKGARALKQDHVAWLQWARMHLVTPYSSPW